MSLNAMHFFDEIDAMLFFPCRRNITVLAKREDVKDELSFIFLVLFFTFCVEPVVLCLVFIESSFKCNNGHIYPLKR